MFDFLTELVENNNKEWFDAHKAHMNRLNWKPLHFLSIFILYLLS